MIILSFSSQIVAYYPINYFKNWFLSENTNMPRINKCWQFNNRNDKNKLLGCINVNHLIKMRMKKSKVETIKLIDMIFFLLFFPKMS